MIHASDLFMVVDEVICSLLDNGDEPRAEGAANVRERLIEFAGLHDLSVQATATLYRVASGEVFYSPVTRTVVEQ